MSDSALVGLGVCLCAALHYVAKLYMTHASARDLMGGGAPTLDGLIFPPLMGVLGVFLLSEARGWLLIGTWLALLALAIAGFRLAETIGKRRSPVSVVGDQYHCRLHGCRVEFKNLRSADEARHAKAPAHRPEYQRARAERFPLGLSRDPRVTGAYYCPVCEEEQVRFLDAASPRP
jgi:hypothetical protein